MGKKRRRRSGNWWTEQTGGIAHWVLAAIVGVLVVGTGTVAGLALTRGDATSAAPAPVRTDFNFGSEQPESSSVGFLGDSWAGGTGADPSGPRNGYPGLTATDLGWSAWQAFQGGGTGYTQGNAQGEGPFISRVPALVEFAPNVVVVQGSSNDLRSDYATVNAAASQVFASIRSSLPDARVYALGAINSPASPVDQMNMVRDAVRDAATANGVTWVDGNAEGWLDVATDFADGFHPNNEGHAKVAERLAAVLAAG